MFSQGEMNMNITINDLIKKNKQEAEKKNKVYFKITAYGTDEGIDVLFVDSIYNCKNEKIFNQFFEKSTIDEYLSDEDLEDFVDLVFALTEWYGVDNDAYEELESVRIEVRDKDTMDLQFIIHIHWNEKIEAIEFYLVEPEDEECCGCLDGCKFGFIGDDNDEE